jgi:hypothetical protein
MYSFINVWNGQTDEPHRDEILGEIRDPSNHNTISTICHVAFGKVAMIIVIFGILCNTVNVTVLSRPKLKGVIYVYLLSLALTNLPSLIIAIPTLLSISKPFEAMSYNSYALAIYFAHLEIPILNTFIATSVYITLFTTINTFVAVHKPNYFRKVYTYKNAYISICLSFFFGVLLNLPHFALAYVHEVCLDIPKYIKCPIYNRTKDYNYMKSPETELVGATDNRENDYECQNKTFIVCSNDEHSNSVRMYTYASTFFLRLGPVIAISILTISIVVRLNKFVKSRAELVYKCKGGEKQIDQGGLHTPQEKMMIVVLVTIAITFVICNTPSTILTILFIKDPAIFSRSVGYAIFRAISNNLELLGLCLNLIIYCICSSEIRRAYSDIFLQNRLVCFIKARLH